MKKIFYVSALLTPEIMELTVKNANVIKETDKQVNTDTQTGGKILIYKKDFCELIVKSSHTMIIVGTHCFQEQVEEMKAKVSQKLKDVFVNMKSGITEMEINQNLSDGKFANL